MIDSDALEKVIQDEMSRQGLMVTKLVLITEQIHVEDSERTINVMVGDDLRTWDALGMVSYVVADLTSAIGETRRQD